VPVQGEIPPDIMDKIVVLDYSLSQIQLAQERLGRNERYIFVAADVYRLPFVSGLFDSATMIRVLHHLAEPVKALIQVRRVLQPSGIFILEFANKQNLKAITRYVFGLQDWNPFTQDSVEFVHLNFDFHPSAISQWLTETNFLLQRQLTVSHFRIGWLKKLVPTKLLVWFDSIAQLTGDLWQLTPSVFTKSTAIGMIGSKKPEGDSFFRCPICEYALPSQAEGSLICAECGTSWPFLDGIYDFRILDQ